MTKKTRRDFLYLSAASLGAVGLGSVVMAFIKSMNPAKDVKALASVEVNLSGLQPGQTKTIVWRGKPVFLKRRTIDEIKKMDDVDLVTFKDPQTDKERFGKNPEYLVVVGVCTHLGCIPNQRESMTGGEGGGWLCACHGSYYDDSGRIVRGPAPKNLEVPPYEILNNNATIRIG